MPQHLNNTAPIRWSHLRCLVDATLRLGKQCVAGALGWLLHTLGRLWRWIDGQFVARFAFSFSLFVVDGWRSATPLGLICLLLTLVTAPWWLLFFVLASLGELLLKWRARIVAFGAASGAVSFFLWFYWYLAVHGAEVFVWLSRLTDSLKSGGGR